MLRHKVLKISLVMIHTTTKLITYHSSHKTPPKTQDLTQFFSNIFFFSDLFSPLVRSNFDKNIVDKIYFPKLQPTSKHSKEFCTSFPDASTHEIQHILLCKKSVVTQTHIRTQTRHTDHRHTDT